MSTKRLILSVCLCLPAFASVCVTHSIAADVVTVGNLQVQGMVESTSGGFKFPDGSTLNTAGLNGLLFNVGFVVDDSSSNTGNLYSGAIKFGSASSGEGIASQQSSGTNLNGLDFYTNSVARLSILNNGYIGIGTRSPDFPLTVSLAKAWTHARFGDTKPTYIGSNGSWIGGNLYWDSTSYWRYGSNGEASLIFLDEGGLNFATTVSGTAGSNATPIWGLKLMNGKLRVGDKANPSEALDVAGNIKASGSLTVAGGSSFSSSIGTAITANATSGMGVSGTAASLGGAGIYGRNSAGGEAVVGLTTSTSGTATGAVVGRNDGPGYGVRGFVATNSSGDAIGVFGQVGISGSTGRAGRFENNNMTNLSNALEVETNSNGVIPAPGGGHAGYFKVNNANSVSAAVKGEVNTIFANFGAAGIYGVATGTGGVGGLFYYPNTNGSGNALLAAYYGRGDAFFVDHAGSDGNIAVFASSGNKARIDKAGKGYFNGGTQNSGADVAELFAVEGSLMEYEAGDVLEVSTSLDRTVVKSSTAYSMLVAGVYATKPGVLLTEESIDTDLSKLVPLGVVGVIPTKVCDENGPIRRGDILVSSSRVGYAMKAELDKIKPGQVIGKALEELNGHQTGKIRVLVSVR